MENRSRSTLAATVDPIFFAFSCLLLILVMLSAQIMIRDIMKESDDGAAILSLLKYESH